MVLLYTHRRTWNVSNKGGLEKLAILSPFKCSLMSVVKRERKRSFNCHHKRIEKEFLKPSSMHGRRTEGKHTYIHTYYMATTTTYYSVHQEITFYLSMYLTLCILL